MKNIESWDKLELRKKSGTEKVRCVSHLCASRKNKRDRSVYVRHDTGTAHCYYCETMYFRDELKSNDGKGKEYVIPVQPKENAYGNFGEKLGKWLVSERRISIETCKRLGVTEQKNQRGSAIVFNYFERETVVRQKFRTGNKKMWSSADSKQILYNINSCIGKKKIYITEGEFDVLALCEIGLDQKAGVVSLPNGANVTDDVFVNSAPYFEPDAFFVICTDNDEKGIKAREELVHRLTKAKCSYIEWKGEGKGVDANDVLKVGTEELKKQVANEVKFQASNLESSANNWDLLLNLYENGLPDTYCPSAREFGGLNKKFSVMRGQVTTITGIPSHGKSEFTDNFVISLINEYDLKGAWFSPEHSPLELYKTKFIQKISGRNFWKQKTDSYGGTVERITKDEVEFVKDWMENRIYFLNTMIASDGNWDWLFKCIEEMVLLAGIDCIVIDAFNKVILDDTTKAGIDKVMTKLTALTTRLNIFTFLVAHPTKMQKGANGLYEPPTLYNVSGSSDFRNQTHNGYCIYRYFADVEDPEIGMINKNQVSFINLKTKFDFQGEISATELYNYNMINQRYYVDELENNDFIFQPHQQPEPEQTQPIKAFSTEHLTTHDYDDIEEQLPYDDVPF